MLAGCVADQRLETVEFYKVSKLKIEPLRPRTKPPTPWRGVSPARAVYRERGPSAASRADLPGEMLELHLRMLDAGGSNSTTVSLGRSGDRACQYVPNPTPVRRFAMTDQTSGMVDAASLGLLFATVGQLLMSVAAE